MSSLPTFSATELEKHRSSKSCYVTVGSKVFDVTSFLEDHPGGDQLILDYAGKDVTAILKDELSHSHSEAAYDILDDYHVGFLSPSVPSPPRTPNPGSNVDPLTTRPPSATTITGMTCEEDLYVTTDPSADFKKHKFLDLNKPLLMQVWRGNFKKDFYLEQVHKPRHYKGGESAPFFGNFLEPLSKTPWYVVPMVWLPWITYGTYRASEGLPLWAVPVCFTLGLCFWTLIEYLMHRCLFHLDEKMPDNRVAITLHFLMHGVHHYLPMDRLRLVMPPTLFVALATPFWKLAHTVFWFNWYVATGVFCGGIFGYVCYDLCHYFLHHAKLPKPMQETKKYHLQHHFADYQKGFGVTSKFWDKVFGTELFYGPGLKTQ